MSESEGVSLDRRYPRLPLGTLLVLGVKLAQRGMTPRLSLVVIVLTAACGVALSLALRSGGRDAPIHDVLLLASSALAWGGGFLLAFGAAGQALRKDSAEGVLHLIVTRTSVRGYLVARVFGLALLLVLVLVAALCVVAACALAVSTPPFAGRVWRSSFGALAYLVAFALVLSPVSFAVVGARSRSAGYMFFLGVVVLPSIVAGALTGLVPERLREVMAIPSALATLRDALARFRGVHDLERIAIASLSLSVFAVAALAFVALEGGRLARRAHVEDRP